MTRVGVDAGGTFTDFVVDDGRSLKVPSRPEDPAGLVRDVLAQLGVGRCEVVFSTTAATNALLERRGGPTKLFTTAGFEDVLEIARQQRLHLYALAPTKAVPLLDVADRHGVAERVAVDGSVLTALTDHEIARCVALVPTGATVAICFLHGHAYAAHEQALAAALRAKGFHVSVSSEVAPLPREYERTSTTVIDAYVAPTLGRTLAALRADMDLRVMESTGGARGESVRPARTVLSGPAAGIVAAEQLCAHEKLDAAIALDVGGTSTDLALIEEGRAARVEELTIDGLPVALPSVAVRTAGAGGGSIAWLDGAGVLKLGPRSAGATPGPAAYGRGGTEPTVTDAHVVLGRLGETLCGGTVVLDRAAAEAAIAPLASALGTSIVEAASAIVAVMDATIARAVGSAALGASRDGLVLLAYGGASGLHAVEVARRTGIAHVLVPPAPGLFCARGALLADVVVERIVACRETAVLSAAARAHLDAMSKEVRAELAKERQGETRLEQTARMRYAGQGIDGELELPVLHLDAFAEAHHAAYGYVLDRPIEVTGLRVRGRVLVTTQLPAPVRSAATPTTRDVGGDRVPVHARGSVTSVHGPAIIEELSSTLWLPAGATATTDDDGNLRITTEAS